MSDVTEIGRASSGAEPDLASRPSPGESSGRTLWFDPLFDMLVGVWFREADISERKRARFMVGTLLIAVAVALSVLVGRASQGVPAVMIYSGALLVSATGLLIAFRAGAPLVVVSNATIGLAYVASVGLVLASGGEAIPAVLMSTLLPLVAYGILGRRAAILWSAAVLAGIFLTALYAQSTDEFLYSGNMLAWKDWRFPSMVLMLGFIMLSALGVEWTFERSAEENDELQAQIKHQADRYRDLVENVGDCMMEYDADYRCIYASPNWEELVGRAPETLLGRGYLDCLHSDDLEDIGERNDSLLAKPGTTVKYKSRVRHVRGHWIEGEVSARTFYSRDGEKRMVTIFRDLSELYQAQRALRHNDRLATAGTLAAGVAHQINNPIGAIRMASEYALLTVDEGDIDLIKEVLETNIEESARCGKIVRSLLQFASREHQKKKRQDLHAVLERSCELTRSFGGKRGVRIRVAASDVVLPVEISEIEIEQVIVNLVQNAIESQPRSNCVDVVARREDRFSVVEVLDDGCGISSEHLEQIFDPFFTTRLEDGGSGLGLSVALGIARGHGGTLEVESEEGSGSCFRLRLPLAASVEEREPDQRITGSLAKPRLVSDGRRSSPERLS